MNHRTFPRKLLILCCAVLLLPGLSSAQQRPQFSARVELVQLQVGLADASGGFVRGLGIDDFEVLVNGAPRPAQVAYEVDLRVEDRVGVAAIARSGVNLETRPVAARRHMLLFFDFSFTSRRGVLEARRAALEFVQKNIHTSDLVAVATSSRYGIELLSPFTSNPDQIYQAVNGLGLVRADDTIVGGIDENLADAMAELQAGPIGDTGGLESLPAIEFREYVANVANYTAQLEQFGHMLQGIEGRKHVIMFSRGFDDRAIAGADLELQGAQADARAASPAGVASSDPEMMWGAAEIREGMADAVEMFRNADAVVHAIDPTGMRAGFEAGSFSPTNGRTGRQALTFLTDGTGGEAYWNINDLSTALSAIDESTSSFYLIAYRKEPGDPETVDLEVRVRRPGVRVVSAPARLTPPPDFVNMNEMQRQLQLAEVLADDGERRVINFDSQVTAFPAVDDDLARAALVLEINGFELDRLATLRGADEIQLEIAGFALGAGEVVLDEFRRKVRIDVAAMRAAGSLGEQAFRYSDYVDVPAGEGRLRLLIRESIVGELSAATRGFYAREITGDDGLVLVRPLVVDSVTVPPLPDVEDRFDPLEFEGRRFAPIAAPTVPAGGVVELLIVAYNVPLDPDTDAPLAGLVLDLDEGPGGQVHRLRDFQIVGSARSSKSGATRLLVRVPIPASVRAGDVSLWTQIIDRADGARREEQTRLFISPQ